MFWFLAAAAAISAIGSISQGIAANDAAKYNAALAEQDAKSSRLEAQAEADRLSRDAYRRMGTARNSYKGISLEGSPLEVFQDMAMESELDRLITLYQGESRARAFEAEARLQRFQGKQAKRQGFFNAASTLLSAGYVWQANQVPTSSPGGSKIPSRGSNISYHGGSF